MARGNLIQGQGSGKVGDVVFMVRQGQQVSRVYTESGARSGKEASEASRIQRVKFGSASNQWNLYRYVCTRMYRKGRSSNQSDYNYFVKKNSLLLPYLSKQENADGVHVLQPGTYSEGSFGRIDLLHFYVPTYTEGEASYALFDSAHAVGKTVSWNSTILSMKQALRGFYPSARKVTYLFSFASELTIEDGGMSFASQSVNHEPVVIDLYDERGATETTATVAEYFVSHLNNARMKAIISPLTTGVIQSEVLFQIIPTSAADNTFLGSVGILFFATDDNAGDCYTTILPPEGINQTAGVYADWAGYRTASSLRIAADSYGYQQGVMRDTIAAYGNDISAVVQAYAARLAKVSSKASATFLKSVGDVSEVQAKAVRKSTEEK